MGEYLKRCPNCGRMDYFVGGDCFFCGYAVSFEELNKMEKEAKKLANNISDGDPWAALRRPEENDSDKSTERNSSTSVMQYASNDIDKPQIWMYIAAAIVPVLQWIFLGIYVAKNKMEDALKLFVVPIMIQVIAVILLIIYYKM